MQGPDGRYMFGLVKVGEKGQVVIPKEARDAFNIKPGDSLLMLGDENQGIAIVKPDLYKELINAIFGVKENKKE